MAVQAAGCAREDGAGAGERGCVSSERSETQSCRWLLLGRQRPHDLPPPPPFRLGPPSSGQQITMNHAAVQRYHENSVPPPTCALALASRATLGLTSPPADAVHVAGRQAAQRCAVQRRKRCLAALVLLQLLSSPLGASKQRWPCLPARRSLLRCCHVHPASTSLRTPSTASVFEAAAAGQLERAVSLLVASLRFGAAPGAKNNAALPFPFPGRPSFPWRRPRPARAARNCSPTQRAARRALDAGSTQC
ncbi:hypothetical protein B0J12DRAFT_317867 [Macrophomina phaseolina]|uniref:Uncharacterized protein n=1 Tax=Macrophomina phaseolina TaxID=35725 RepID=A0ABQ8FYV8_9PEZI|nr:hypothetical protein B0J12DRAFT_317867 [Macrophomina phaseolina]